MAKIQLTPAELTAQGQEMEKLQSEYEALFKETKSVLNQVNGNWSANLSNNFSSKIKTAQKTFSNVTSMLATGATLAKKSASNLETMDQELAKMMGTETVSGGGSGGGGGGSYGDDDTDVGKSNAEKAWDKIVEYVEESYEESGDVVRYLEEEFAKLPDWVRENIEKAAGSDVTTALKITGDILKGEIGLDTLSSFLSGIGMEGTKVSGIIKAIDMVVNKKGKFGELTRGMDYLLDEEGRKVREGDYAGALVDGLAYTGVGLFTVAYGSLDIINELIGDTVSKSVDTVTSTIDTVGHLIPGDAGETIQDIADGVESVGSAVSGFFNNILT